MRATGWVAARSNGDVHLRFIVSRIITSVSQLPTPGPPRRERVGKTRFCRVFMPAFATGGCASDCGLPACGGAGDEEDAVGCWLLAARGRAALGLPLRALAIATPQRQESGGVGRCPARRRRQLDSRCRGGLSRRANTSEFGRSKAIGFTDSTPTKSRARQSVQR